MGMSQGISGDTAAVSRWGEMEGATVDASIDFGLRKCCLLAEKEETSASVSLSPVSIDFLLALLNRVCSCCGVLQVGSNTMYRTP